MMSADWFWDHAASFQGNHRFFFIGLENKKEQYYWLDGSMVSYSDWYISETNDGLSQYILSYDDIGSTSFLDITHTQPVSNDGSLCVGMFVKSPFLSLNWMKVPCRYPVFRAGVICKMAATPKGSYRALRVNLIAFVLLLVNLLVWQIA